MRSNEERVAAVKRRVRQLEAQRRRSRSRIAVLSSAAACLAIIVAAACAMPGVMERLTAGNYAGYETAASIFGGSTTIGYIVIGLLAFVLGVLVTLLMLQAEGFDRRGGENSDDRDH